MIKIGITGTLLLLLSTLILGQNSPSPKEIMEKSRQVSKLTGMEAISTLKIFDAKGRERTRKISVASRTFENGTIEKRIIRFLAPAEVKGTGMLIFDYDASDDDMWIYMPALRKTRRIVSSEKGKSFMGSEFSNADMSAPNLEDYTYTLVGIEFVNEKECWKIEMIPVSEEIMDEIGVTRKISWIGEEDYVLRKSEYYDLDDELWKILSASEVENLSTGKYMATYMKMENVQNGRRSEFSMDEIQYNPEVKEEYFTVSFLEKF